MQARQVPIGGHGFIVEVDELCLGHVDSRDDAPYEGPKRKNSKVLHGEWRGAVVRGEGKVVLSELPTKSRLGPVSAEEVLPNVAKYIKEDSILMTDGLKAYRVINESEARWKELLGWNASQMDGFFFET